MGWRGWRRAGTIPGMDSPDLAPLRRDLRLRVMAGTDPRPTPYLVVLCEADRCVPVTDLPEQRPEAAEAVLARQAACYRTDGVVGRLMLVNRRTGVVVVVRRVWP